MDLNLNDILCALAKLRLKSIHCGEYLVIMKSEFDVMISGEPYHALMMLVNMDSGKFMTRVWNKNVVVGKVTSLAEITHACINHFRPRRLCLGLLENTHEQNKHKFLIMP